MAEVQWIKLAVDMFDNRKIRHLRRLPEGNNIILIWVMLLTMAGRCNAGGMIFLTENIPYTPKMLADELGFEENTVKLALEALATLNMVSMNGNLSIIGWEEHQNINGLEHLREQNRVRKQRQRERERLALCDCHVTVTQGHATEEEIEEDKDKDLELEEEYKLNDNNKGLPLSDAVETIYDKPTVNEQAAAAIPENPELQICVRIAKAWNKTGYTKARSVQVSKPRGQEILARVREYGIETVLDTIRRAGASEFLPTLGDRITLDWFLKPEIFQRVMEGAYDNLFQRRGERTESGDYVHGADRLREMIERGDFDE